MSTDKKREDDSQKEIEDDSSTENKEINTSVKESSPPETTESETKPKVQQEAKPQTKLKPEIETKPEAEAQIASKTKVESEVKPEIEAEEKVEAEVKVEPKVETEVIVKAEPEIEEKTKVESEVKPEIEANLKIQAKVEANVEAEAKVESKIETEVNVEAEANIEAEAKAEPKVETETILEAKAEIKIEENIEAEPKVEAEVKVEDEAKTEIEAKVETEVKVEIEVKVEAEVKVEDEAKVETEVKIEVEDEVKVEAEVKVETEPEVRAEPKAKVGAEIEPNLITEARDRLYAPYQNLEKSTRSEIREKIQEEDVIRDLNIPFLEVKRKTFEHPLVFENCYFGGVAIRGSHLKGDLTFRNCNFGGKVHIGRLAEQTDGIIRSVIEGNVRFEKCEGLYEVFLHQSEVKGDVHFVKSQFGGKIVLDKSQINGRVEFLESECCGCSAFQADFGSSFAIVRSQIHPESEGNGAKVSKKNKNSLDLKRASISKALVIQESKLKGKVSLQRLRVGEHSHRAMIVEHSSLGLLDFGGAKVEGHVQFTRVKCLDQVLGKQPQKGNGQKAGKSTYFWGDVTFHDCHFYGKLDFHAARFQNYMNFRKCVLDQGGHFSQSEFSKAISFWESEAKGSLHFRKAHFHERANFARTQLAGKTSFNDAVFEGEALFIGARVSGDLFFTGAEFRSDFNMNQSVIDGGLTLKGIKAKGDVNLSRTSIKDRFICSEAEFEGTFKAPGLSIGTWGSLAFSEFHSAVQLSGLKVGFNVPENAKPFEKIETKTASKKTKKSQSVGKKKPLIVPGSFYADKTIFHNGLQISSANIRGQFSLESTRSNGEFELVRLSIGHDFVMSKGLFRGPIRCGGTNCQGDISVYEARFKEEVSFSGMQCTNMGLSRTSFDQELVIRGTQIQNTLSMNKTSISGKCDLSRTSFDRFFFHQMLADYLIVQRKELGEQISSEKAGNYEQARNEYGILKQAFLQRSQYHDMDWAYYRFSLCDRRRNKASFLKPLQSIKKFANWLLLDKGFGYGTKPLNIGWLAFGIILLFAGVYYLVPQGMQGPGSEVIDFISFPDALYMSLVTFASMDYTAVAPYFEHWLKYIFALEGIAGIFLVTLFVATISRKIIRT